MIYDDNKKSLTAMRLSELRKKAGLTFEELAEELTKRYGDIDSPDGKYIISTGTLKNYEISNPEHEKFKSGFGMNIQFLTMFSDFYNVSTDYLLGLTDSKLPNIEDRAIQDRLGLSEKAIEVLTEWNVSIDDNFGFGSRDLRALNALLDEVYDIMERNSNHKINTLFSMIGLYLYGDFEHRTEASKPLNPELLDDPIFQLNNDTLFIVEKGRDDGLAVAYDVNKVMKSYILDSITEFIRRMNKEEDD